MAHVYRGERTFLHPVLRPVERFIYRVCGVDETARDGRPRLHRVALVFNFIVLLFIYAVLRLQGAPAAQPGARARDERLGRLQHRRQLRDQHQLAGLRPRDVGELPHPDARAGARELRLGRHGHGRRGGLHPRPDAPLDAASSATSGSTSRAASSTSCCRSAIVGALRARLAGRRPEPRRPDARSRPSRASRRPSRQGPVASQEIIKELGTNGGGFFNANSAHPFENPTPLTNFIEMLAHPRHPRGLHLHVRQVRRQPAPGLGALRRGHGARW